MKTALISLFAIFTLTGCATGLLPDSQMANYERFGEIYHDARETFCQGQTTKFHLSEYSIRIECADGSDFVIKTPQ